MLQSDSFSLDNTWTANHFLFLQFLGGPFLFSHLQVHYPLQYLATLGRKNLCVPATSTQAECVFSGMEWLLKKEGFVCQENLPTCNCSWRTVLGFRLLLSLRYVFDNKLTPFISENGFSSLLDSYFSLLNLSFGENNPVSIFTTFAKQSMINRLSNPINRNRSAAKISKVMSSSFHSRQDEGAEEPPSRQGLPSWSSHVRYSQHPFRAIAPLCKGSQM